MGEGYAVLQEYKSGCFVPNRYLVIAAEPCVGIESAQCTLGQRGEEYWKDALNTAKEKGFSVSDRNQTPFGVYLNPINGRSQHQLHIKIAYLPTVEPVISAVLMAREEQGEEPMVAMLLNGTDVLENGTLADVLESGRTNVTILASVNIPPGAYKDGLKPFRTALELDEKTVKGRIPYGTLLIPYYDGSTGYILTNFYNLDLGSIVRSDSPGQGDCVNLTGIQSLSRECFTWGPVACILVLMVYWSKLV